MDGIGIAVDEAFIIGESPLWVPEEGAVYWIDIKAPALFKMELASGARRRWGLSSDVGGFALLPEREGAVVALRYGLFRLGFADGRLTLLAPPPFDPARFRFNEGACDPAGRFWVGVMCDPLDPRDTRLEAGPLCRFSLREGLVVTQDRAELHNGMAFSEDGTAFFLAHSNAHRILRYRLDEAGWLHDPVLFATTPPELGVPDGAAIDTEGGYWCALHGGGRLRRFHADGRMDRDVMLPVRQPTMAAFAGPGLDTFYLTSASEKMTAEEHRAEPLAGKVLRFRPGERGVTRRGVLAG